MNHETLLMINEVLINNVNNNYLKSSESSDFHKLTIYSVCKTGLKKKSELMLMRRARAYSSCFLQIILVYLYPSCCNSLQPKIARTY